MSEATPSNPAPDAQAPQLPIRMHGQYIRDLSFEVPNAPDIFREFRQGSPEIEVALDTAVRNLQGNSFEVILSVTVDAAINGRKAFILELAYSAFVELASEVPEEHKQPILLIEIPRQMFPFVRQLVSSISGQSGFPPLMLEMIDFADVYRRRYGDGQPPAPGPQPSVH